jgi:hypothetical protein
MSTIAPAALLRQELHYLQSREVLRTTLDIEEMILIQSLEGRAHEGHGSLHGRRFVDTTEDDIALALRLDPRGLRRDRQRLLDDIKNYARRAMTGAAPAQLLDEAGEPLLGIGFFRFMEVDPRGVLQGLYLGGLRDTPEARAESERRYGASVGGGRLYFVNTRVMRQLGLNGERLAHEEHAGQIERYRAEGLIVDEPPSPENSIRYMYIRHRRGSGASDDAAIVAGSMRWGGAVSAGVFLADAMDTLEKYVPADCYADQDADLAREIAAGAPDLGVGLEDVYALVAISAGGEGVPDSSLRHMLRVDRKVDQCALEAHLLAAAGRPYAPVNLAHEKIPNSDLYHEVERRIAAMKQ